jgi:hypothetical protein
MVDMYILRVQSSMQKAAIVVWSNTAQETQVDGWKKKKKWLLR